MSEQVLIATLGSEPQVVTLALDLLRAQGYPIGAVRVIHTMGESVQAGLKMRSQRSTRDGRRETGPVLGPRSSVKPVEDGGWPVSDVASERETAALMRTLYSKKSPMAAYGMVVAQLLFDDNDHVWHYHSYFRTFRIPKVRAGASVKRTGCGKPAKYGFAVSPQ